MITLDIGNIRIDGVTSTRFLATREEGKFVREYIAEELEKLENGDLLILDFTNVTIIDWSCSDEIIAKLVSRLKGKEFGDRYICLSNLSKNHKENINAALSDKNIATAVLEDNGLLIIGSINTYLHDTFKYVINNEEVTARQLADSAKIQINTASTRLLNLYKECLVKREEDAITEGAKQFVYKSLI
ncbi:MAG: hypothetical protein BWY74_00666 [Firmicutes bacterium ADurb.Bin419]|nr:MAG: hypothetical protein BWY74_00666 [Firmicutes bacterium ADurb.Bin419]